MTEDEFLELEAEYMRLKRYYQKLQYAEPFGDAHAAKIEEQRGITLRQLDQIEAELGAATIDPDPQEA